MGAAFHQGEGSAPLLIEALRRGLPADKDHFADEHGQRAEILITALGNLRDPGAVPAIAEWGIWTRVHEVRRPPSYYLPSEDPDLQYDERPHDPYPLETVWIGALRRIGGPEAEATAALGEGGHDSSKRYGRWLP